MGLRYHHQQSPNRHHRNQFHLHPRLRSKLLLWRSLIPSSRCRLRKLRTQESRTQHPQHHVRCHFPKPPTRHLPQRTQCQSPKPHMYHHQRLLQRQRTQCPMRGPTMQLQPLTWHQAAWHQRMQQSQLQPPLFVEQFFVVELN